MSELTLYTETVIDSCHQLKGYDGNCKRLHGHSWLIRLWIKGDDSNCDDVGIMFDFGKIKFIKDKYDHRLLNEIEPFTKINPTAENISKVILEELEQDTPDLFFKLRVYETAVGKNTYCERVTPGF